MLIDQRSLMFLGPAQMSLATNFVRRSVGRSVWDVCMDGVCIQSRSGLRQDGTPPPKKHTRNCLEVKLDANAQRGARGVSFRVANCLNRLSARCSKLGVH